MQSDKINIGTYLKYNKCRFCLSDTLMQILHLGYVPLAGGFLKKPEFNKEKHYPLEIYFCTNCFLVQSTNVIDRDTLFQDYFYHSSAIKTLDNHFAAIARKIKQSNEIRNPFIVEIGCNDGVLMKHMLKNKLNYLGIDPATNVVSPLITNGMPILNTYFSTIEAKKIANTYGRADIICSFNVLAHIENMHDIIKGIKLLLKEDGYLFFENHYLGNLLEEMQYDFFYHEHQYYYSLITLQKLFAMHAMEIYDVRPIPIHGGSMRYYVQNKKTGTRQIHNRVNKLQTEELTKKYNKLDTYTKFGNNIEKSKNELISLLKTLKKQRKTIAGYGASGRATTIMSYCGIDKTYLDYIIDDAPAKQGAYTPGNHLKIVASDILTSNNKPDYVLVFAWSFIEEIKKKNHSYLDSGGAFIIPLPSVTIMK